MTAPQPFIKVIFLKKKTNKKRNTHFVTKLMGKEGNPNSLIIYQPKPAGEFAEAHQKSQNRFIKQV